MESRKDSEQEPCQPARLQEEPLGTSLVAKREESDESSEEEEDFGVAVQRFAQQTATAAQVVVQPWTWGSYIGPRLTAASEEVEGVCQSFESLAFNKCKHVRALPSGLGLKWKDVGATEPTAGTEIKNAPLAVALKRKVEFKKEEFENFQVVNLSGDSYIKVGESYYTPTPLPHTSKKKTNTSKKKKKPNSFDTEFSAHVFRTERGTGLAMATSPLGPQAYTAATTIVPSKQCNVFFICSGNDPAFFNLGWTLMQNGVDYIHIDMDKEDNGWHLAITQNNDFGGSMKAPIFIYKDSIWWGVDTEKVQEFVTMLKDLQIDDERASAR